METVAEGIKRELSQKREGMSGIRHRVRNGYLIEIINGEREKERN